jgi:heme o synthase
MSQPTVALPSRSAPGRTAIADYAQLSRPRIAMLIAVVVAVSGYVGARGAPDLRVLAKAVLGTFFVAASASACNQLLERRRDGLMDRTARRPLPTGRLGSSRALLFSGLTACAGLAYLAWAVHWQPAFWGAVTWGLYVAAYTPLKTRTPWNTAVGAVVGAVPVWMGWSAVGGVWNPLADPNGWALFGVQFLWQFPHFLAIAWIYRRQYERSGMRMLTVVDPSGRQAGAVAVLGAVALLPVSALPACTLPGGAAAAYLGAAVLLGLAQLGFAVRFSRHRSDRSARLLLRATLLYLPLLLLALGLATKWAR